MAMAFLIALAFLFFLFSLAFLLTGRLNHKLNLPPGPSNLPIIGSLHHLRNELPHISLHKLSQKHGPLMYLNLGSVPTVVSSSPATAKEFLKTHDLDCCSRPLLSSLNKLSYAFNDIVFTPYGEQWRELRKTCIVHLFSPKKVAEFRSIREVEVQRMIGSISSQSKSKNSVVINLSEEFYCLASDVTCRTALGKRYYGGDGATLRRVLSETQELFNAFFFIDYIPMLGWLDWFTGLRGKLDKNFGELDGFYQRVIDEHRDPTVSRDDKHEDAIDALLSLQKKGETYLTDDHIKGVVMNLFVAGSDTSSATLEWAMTELMRNPEAMSRAQKEVRGLVSSKAMVDERDLDHLPYLKSVIKETMRVHCPVPLLVQRETIRHCKINGYDVPAKYRLLVNAWAIGRDVQVWERPDEFNPDRFMDCPIDYKGQDFEFIPFGAGRRICPGMSPGVLVVELGLANLLYRFDWKLPEGMLKEDIDMEGAPGVTVHRKSALCLVATSTV